MKHYYFFIDDNIWVFRDLATQKPKSIFEHPYLNFLKSLHDRCGTKTQLNCFYSTDPRHKGPYFDLSLMPDTYKDEWISNSHWLKLAFHASREFPDYPYVNVTYDQFKFEYDRVVNNIIRFAGEQTLARELTIHCMPLSKAGYKVLTERGIRALCCSHGYDASSDIESKLRPQDIKTLFTNRTEETSLPYYNPNPYAGGMDAALRAFNHIHEDINQTISTTSKFYTDNEHPIPLKDFVHMVLNTFSLDQIIPNLDKWLTGDFVGFCMHEQYFYPEYKSYQPDYCAKIEAAVKHVTEKGFTSIFMNEIL